MVEAEARRSAGELATLIYGFKVLPGKTPTLQVARTSVLSKLQQQHLVTVEGALLADQHTRLDSKTRQARFIPAANPAYSALPEGDLLLRVGSEGGRPHVCCRIQGGGVLLAQLNAAIGSRIQVSGFFRCSPQLATFAPDMRLFEINPVTSLVLGDQALLLPDIASAFSGKEMPAADPGTQSKLIGAGYDKETDVLTLRLRRPVPTRLRASGTLSKADADLVAIQTLDGLLDVTVLPGLVAPHSFSAMVDRHIVVDTITTFDLASAMQRKPTLRLVAIDQGEQPSIRGTAVADVPALEDQLGFAPFVGGLHGLLNDEQTTFPVTVAVTGPWGGGKSSVMRQLQARLAHRGPVLGRTWYIVTFPAWKYETSQAMWTALAKKIYEDARSQMSYPQRVWFRLELEARRQGVARFLIKGIGPAVGILVAGLSAVAAGLIRDLASILLVSGSSLAALLAGASAFWGIIGDPFSRAIDSFARKETTREVFGFTPEADENVRQFIQVLTRRRHLVVFVDDLDRCNSRSVVSVIETINQIFNSDETSRAAFILGMDRAMVTTGIEVAYRETINYLAERNDQRAETFGEDFLAKVVQVSVQVPRPAEDAMETLLEVVMQPRTEKPPTGNNAEESRPSAEQSEATVAGSGAPAAKVGDESGGAHLETAGGLRSTSTPEPMRPPIAHQPGQLERRLPKLDKQLLRAASEVIGSMDPNPRLLKRFANAYRLQLHVATLMDHEEVDLRPSQLVAFAKWVLIRLQWPALAVSLDADADGELLASLEERSGHKGATRPKGGPRAQNKPAPAWTKWLEDARLNDLLQLGGEPARISNLPDEVLLRVY